MSGAISQAYLLAISLAQSRLGATTPNPSVGAVLLSEEGEIIGSGFHNGAGMPHAEVECLTDWSERIKQLSQPSAEGTSKRLRPHTMIVTLEPCHHFGRTPPCSELIARSGITKVIYGAPDPHAVAQGGAEFLKKQGLRVELSLDPYFRAESEKLIRGFHSRVSRSRPWITIKTAHRFEALPHTPHFAESMIPPKGQSTFTSPELLRLAHILRKQSDTIVTGIGTVLSDHPQFTVRHVPDHERMPFKRNLLVLDRKDRMPSEWRARAQASFEVHTFNSIPSLMEFMSSSDRIQNVLVEAGPQVSRAMLDEGFWDEHVIMTETPSPRTQFILRETL